MNSHSDKKRRALLPYGTDFSAPRIDLPDVELWQNQRGSLARAYFEDRIYSMRESYQELMDLAMLNEQCYGAEYNFEPVIGNTYHLYRMFCGKMVLSLIDPPWSSMEYVGTVTYTADSVFKRLTHA